MLFGVFSGGYWERHTDLSIALRFSVRPLTLLYVCLFGPLPVCLCRGLSYLGGVEAERERTAFSPAIDPSAVSAVIRVLFKHGQFAA